MRIWSFTHVTLTGNVIYNNIFYGNHAGLVVEDEQTNLKIKNNLFAENTAGGGTEELSMQSGKTYSGLGVDYNLYYRASGTTYWKWGATNYNFADWKTNSGLDAHSLNADPLFTNPSANDFTLQSSSPAIDNGANLGYTYNMALDPRTSFPWSTVDQNLYGSNWEIGAFVYIPSSLAQVEPRSDTMSNSAPSATSNHTIVFGAQSAVTGSSTVTISFQSDFSIPANLDCGDVDAATSSQFNFNYPACAATATLWGFSAQGQTITLQAPTDSTANVHVATGTQITVQIGSNASYQQQGVHWITNPSSQGVYKITIEGTFGGSGNMLVAIVNSIALSATIGETLTFTIVGLPGRYVSGDKMAGCAASAAPAADDEDGSATIAGFVTTTAVTVPFGTITPASFYEGCQRLGVQTNASNGYTIYSRENNPLQTLGGLAIADTNCNSGTCTPTSEGAFSTVSGMGISCVNSATSVSCSTANPNWNAGQNWAPIAAESKGLSTAKFSGVTTATSGIIFAKAKYRLRAPTIQAPGTYTNKVSWIVLPVY